MEDKMEDNLKQDLIYEREAARYIDLFKNWMKIDENISLGEWMKQRGEPQ